MLSFCNNVRKEERSSSDVKVFLLIMANVQISYDGLGLTARAQNY